MSGAEFGKAASAELPGSIHLAPQDDSRSIPLVCEHREAEAADDVDLPASPPVQRRDPSHLRELRAQ